MDGRQLAEEEVAEQERPDHRGVVERCNQRGRRPPEALGEEDVADPPTQADRDQRGELEPGRGEPVQSPARGKTTQRPAGQPGERAAEREIEHDRRRGLRLGQAAGLHHRARIAERPAEREAKPERGRGRGRMCADIEVRPEHHQDAAEADEYCRPAVDAHAFLEEDRGQRHRDQRSRERDRGRVDDRQPGECGEIAEHAEDADQATAGMPQRPVGAHRRRELVAPSIDRQHRRDGEGGAEEHGLPDRVSLAQVSHQRRHHCKQQRRHDLERDGLDDVHCFFLAARTARSAPDICL